MGRFQLSTRRAHGAAAVVVTLALPVLAASCSRPKSPPKPAPPAAAPAVQAPAAPVPNPVLTRAQLIAAAAAARDAYARGAPYPDANGDLIGRRFTIKLPFGCNDAAAETDDATVVVDPAKKSLTLSAQPQVWTGAPWLAPIIGDTPPVESVEGFWIRRPWTTSNLCPPTPAPQPAPQPAPAPAAQKGKPAPAPPPPVAAPPPVSAETLGLAWIYRSGDSRLKRHARHPYRVVLKLTDNRIPLDRRFWLVLDGRVASLDGGDGTGQPIRCSAVSADARPACLIGVELDHVSVQAQATGETLADWAS